MAWSALVCLILLADVLLVLAMANKPAEVHTTTVDPEVSSTSSISTTTTTHSRNLSKHHSKLPQSSVAPALSPAISPNPPKVLTKPSLVPQLGDREQPNTLSTLEVPVTTVKPSVAEAPVTKEHETGTAKDEGEIHGAEAPVLVHRRLGKHHHSTDKSVAGGGVILGGLATTFFVSIFCYIRATRRNRKNEETTVTTSS